MGTRAASRPRRFVFSKKPFTSLLGLLLLSAGAVTALACTWSLITDHSVRFNSMRVGRGFYRLPPLPIAYDIDKRKELTVAEIADDQNRREGEWEAGGSSESEAPTPTATQHWNDARAAEQASDLPRLRQLLEKFLSETAVRTDEDDPERQSRRNAAYDMLDAMSALGRGSAAGAVKEYIDARYTYDGSTESAMEAIASAKPDKNLSDNWEYLSAAALQSQSKENALNAFRQHAAKYPHSEKNEAVLYMVAKLTMEFSHSFENTSCGIGNIGQWDQPIEPGKIEPLEKCRDENWNAAVAAFQHLMRRYPNGRYFNDSRGWLAYLYRRGGKRALALTEYYRMLGHPSDINVRLEAKKSLQMIGQEYDDETLDEVERSLADEPRAALAYAYHRIYNQAVDQTYETVSVWGDPDHDAEERQRVANTVRSGGHELDRVARFSSAMLKRYGTSHVGGEFVLRVAQAKLELQDFKEAGKLAGRALEMGSSGEGRAQALWVKGSSEHQQKDLKHARATFGRLIVEFPGSKLSEGAHRLLALTAEDQDDLETALDQYLALKYDYDVAYFVDVLLPTDRLAKFVASRETVPQHDQLLYGLGIRYMRDRRWNDARATLQKIRTKSVPWSNGWQDPDQPNRVAFAKEPDWGSGNEGVIRTSWVIQDLKTIDAMEQLERAVDSAQGDDAKAEAMYQLASYQFDGDSLLFYNPSAWDGQRYLLLSDLDFNDRYRLPNEAQNLFKYSESHESLARSIPIYLELAQRFPNTKAARDGLFTVAVAQERLRNFNPYWRSVYEKGLFAGAKDVDYADVRRAYPSYQMPKATLGWEAATRTVNGGPAWTPKPKPRPKPPEPTYTQRANRWLRRMVIKYYL